VRNRACRGRLLSFTPSRRASDCSGDAAIAPVESGHAPPDDRNRRDASQRGRVADIREESRNWRVASLSPCGARDLLSRQRGYARAAQRRCSACSQSTNTSHLLETTVRGRYALNAEADRTSDRTPRCRPFRERDRLHGDCHSQTEQQRDGGELGAMLVLIAGTWSRLLPYRSKLASRSLRSAAEPWFWGKGRSVGGSAHASTVRWWCPSTASTSGVDRRPGRYWPTAIPAPIRRRPA
jgi:hypothetical protein